MAMYAIAVTPLINHLHQSQPDISQGWFADDATAAGQLKPHLQWWKLVSSTYRSLLWLFCQCHQDLSHCEATVS